jgi:opacity protein-like surface antigen
MGVGLGRFDYERSIDTFGTLFNETASVASLYGGYRFTDHWAIEAALNSTGTAEETRDGIFYELGGPATRSTITSSIEFEAIQLRATVSFPFGWGALFIGGGYYSGDLEASSRIVYEDGTITASKIDASQAGLSVVGGAQWDLDNLSLRVEYQWWDIDPEIWVYDSADAFSIGVAAHWRF